MPGLQGCHQKQRARNARTPGSAAGDSDPSGICVFVRSANIDPFDRRAVLAACHEMPCSSYKHPCSMAGLAFLIAQIQLRGLLIVILYMSCRSYCFANCDASLTRRSGGRLCHCMPSVAIFLLRIMRIVLHLQAERD